MFKILQMINFPIINQPVDMREYGRLGKLSRIIKVIHGLKITIINLIVFIVDTKHQISIRSPSMIFIFKNCFFLQIKDFFMIIVVTNQKDQVNNVKDKFNTLSFNIDHT